MNYIPRLPIWKRVIVLAQAVTLPVWFLPLVVWIGLREVVPDIIPALERVWELLTAPLPTPDDLAPKEPF